LKKLLFYKVKKIGLNLKNNKIDYY